jgi:hypothetical protein
MYEIGTVATNVGLVIQIQKQSDDLQHSSSS